MSWDRAISFTLKWEGGYVDDPDDSGGKTNMGITESVLKAAYSAKIVPHCNIRALTKAEAIAIYQARYWNPYEWARYGASIDMIQFDVTVNSGPGNMARITQRACVSLGQNITIDGKWGPQTRAALYSLAWSKGAPLAKMLLVKRLNFFDAIVASRPSQKKFLKGWRNRVYALAKAAGVRL